MYILHEKTIVLIECIFRHYYEGKQICNDFCPVKCAHGRLIDHAHGRLIFELYFHIKEYNTNLNLLYCLPDDVSVKLNRIWGFTE